jgi:hypothetical protein
VNDEENFIGRWSRRKREATDEAAHSKKPDPAQTINPSDETSGLGSEISAGPSANEFDVSSLPPIESIGAGTDITAFMQPGVPSALRHAALRRAWAADPAIRNFLGLNENYWNDVAGAAAAPGFGDLDPGIDVKRMVSELFGDPAPEKAESDSAPTSATSAAVSEKVAAVSEKVEGDAGEAQLTEQQEEAASATSIRVAAVHNEPPQRQLERGPARRHGGALPE